MKGGLKMPLVKGLAIKIFDKGFVHPDMPNSIGHLVIDNPTEEDNPKRIGFILYLKPRWLIRAGISYLISEIMTLKMDDQTEELRNNGFCKLMVVKILFQGKAVIATIGTGYVAVKDLFE